MNKIRYIDKKILCDYDFKKELFDILDVKVQDIMPLRKVFVLFTNKGKKILKISDSSEERIEFIDKSLEFIERGFPNVLKYSKNKNGDIITQWGDKRYVLLDMVEGREAVYTNPIEVDLCANAISKMHIASKNISNYLPQKYLENNLGMNLIEKMKTEFLTLVDLENLVKRYKYKNEFDTLFLTYIDDTKRDLEKTIGEIENSAYKDLFNKKEEMILCHNDLAHHNFIIDGEKVSIIDFDYCNIDTRIIDIYGYTIKVIKTLSYDKDIIDLIINSYNKMSKLDIDEVIILKKLMNYPKDFISISINYYFKQKRWDEEVFLTRLKSKLDMDKFRAEMLDNN